MNNQPTPALRLAFVLAACLLLMPAVHAQTFDAVNNAQSPHRVAVRINDANTTYVQTTREFSLSNATNVRVAFVQAPPAGYKADIELKNGTASYQTVGSDVDDTTPTPAFRISNNGTMRATVDIPSVANRDEGLVKLRFSISLPTGTGTGGSGGQEVPSLVHVLEVLYYNPVNDTDGDGLKDTWERENFGNLAQNATGDPDDDGFTNEQEQEADTDPNNRASTPPQTVYEGGAGGGNVNDREASAVAAGLFLMCLAIFIGVLVIVKSSSESWFFRITVPIAISIAVGFVLLFSLESWNEVGKGWAWWSYLHVGVWDVISFALAGAAILIIGTWLAVRVNQRLERHVLVGVTIALIVAAALVYLLFHVLQVPFPSFG